MLLAKVYAIDDASPLGSHIVAVDHLQAGPGGALICQLFSTSNVRTAEGRARRRWFKMSGCAQTSRASTTGTHLHCGRKVELPALAAGVAADHWDAWCLGEEGRDEGAGGARRLNGTLHCHLICGQAQAQAQAEGWAGMSCGQTPALCKQWWRMPGRHLGCWVATDNPTHL